MFWRQKLTTEKYWGRSFLFFCQKSSGKRRDLILHWSVFKSRKCSENKQTPFLILLKVHIFYLYWDILLVVIPLFAGFRLSNLEGFTGKWCKHVIQHSWYQSGCLLYSSIPCQSRALIYISLFLLLQIKNRENTGWSKSLSISGNKCIWGMSEKLSCYSNNVFFKTAWIWLSSL